LVISTENHENTEQVGFLLAFAHQRVTVIDVQLLPKCFPPAKKPFQSNNDLNDSIKL